MNEYVLKIGVSLQRGQFDPKFQIEGVTPPTILLVSKTGINILSCDVIKATELDFFLSQSTRLTDGQTDGQTEF